MEINQDTHDKRDINDEKNRHGSQSGNPSSDGNSSQGDDSHKGGSFGTGKGSDSRTSDISGARGQHSGGGKQSDQGTPKNMGHQDLAHDEHREKKSPRSNDFTGRSSQSGKRSGSQGGDMRSPRGASDPHAGTGKAK